ncbi:MAG: protein translocase subunit SecD [Deltaproteobacteria bacterium]|nr:protein translocase subunit SecD [Deltaproteobacteria bacterium]
MSSGWKYKFWLVLASLCLGCYLLLPTLLGTEAKRDALEAAGEAVPWYFELLPRHGLKLGLDLQGGIYVELEVNLQDALRRKTDLFVNELSRQLEEQDKAFAPVSLTQTTPGQVEITFPSEAALAALESLRDKSRDYRRTCNLQRLDTPDTTTPDAPATQPKARLALSKEYLDTINDGVVAQATESVRNRINRYGVGEPDIRRQGADRIAIELPGLKDPDRALDLIKRTGQLELRLVHEVSSAAALKAQQDKLSVQIAEARKSQNIPNDDFRAETVAKLQEALRTDLPPNSQLAFELIRDRVTKKVMGGIPYLIEDRAHVTGDMLEDALVQVEQNEPKVAFTFNKTGAKIFGDLTKENVGHYLAILLDGTVMSAPVIRTAITGGSGIIELGSGDYDTKTQEARDLTLVLQEGALPATLTEATKTVVGPSLGADLIRQGFRATTVAALAVIIFMIIYYAWSGVLADFAVALNVLLLLAILALFDATLTLPGIAGIVLTIGMAVDANVLVHERVREELRAGRAPKVAVQLGYSNAKRAIIDANLTTLIAGIFLYQFGTGPIKGFAVTLCVGILTTLFTAVFATEAVYEYIFASRKVEKLSI